MKCLRVLLLLCVLPVFASGQEGRSLSPGEVWRSSDSSRSLIVLSPSKVELRDGGTSAVAHWKLVGSKVVVEPRFFGQSLRLEFHRAKDHIVCPDNVKLQISSQMSANDRIERAKRQLSLIGGHLKALEKEQKLNYYSGAAFLLQVRDRMTDEELDAFRGVLSRGDVARKPVGDFRAEIRKVQLPLGVDTWCSAYSGPNWREFPLRRAGKNRRRLWACDRCQYGVPAHDGILLLWDDLEIEFVSIKDVMGGDAVEGLVPVGPRSPDKRLRTMTYFSR